MNSTVIIEDIEGFRFEISEGIPSELPHVAQIDPSVSHAPKRKDILTASEKKTRPAQCFAVFR